MKDSPPRKSDFVNVHGVRLHYLDWGGSGPVLLFLAGLGCNAHIFDRFAPRFTDQFRALALTRRGHGESDYPENGYDIETLTEDIRQFMDCLHIDRAVMVGHSYAGIELSHFSAIHPERVLALVFLDAAFDRTSPEFKDVEQKNPMREIHIPGDDDDYDTIQDLSGHLRWVYPSFEVIWDDFMDEQFRHQVTTNPEGHVVYKGTPGIDQALSDTVHSYVSEDSKIQAPTLNIYAMKENTYYVSPNYMTDEQQAQIKKFFDEVVQPWNRQSIEKFRKDVPHAVIVEIPDAHHYCFIQQEERVYNEMRAFLSECLRT